MLDPLEMTALMAKAGTLDLDPLEMTALTAKAAWWVLEGWKGSAGSLRNDSFDGQSAF